MNANERETIPQSYTCLFISRPQNTMRSRWALENTTKSRSTFCHWINTKYFCWDEGWSLHWQLEEWKFLPYPLHSRLLLNLLNSHHERQHNQVPWTSGIQQGKCGSSSQGHRICQLSKLSISTAFLEHPISARPVTVP